MASLVQVVAIAPAQAVAGENGPAPIPGANTSGLSGSQWETKNQHRIWWNADQTRWDAILPTNTGWRIAKGAIPETFGAAPVYGTNVGLLASNDDRPDFFWDDTANRLYVLMSGESTTQFYALDYTPGTDTYSAPTTAVNLNGMEAPDSRASIFKSSNGDLWASVMDEGGLLVSRSVNDGVTWSATPANLNFVIAEGQTQLTEFSDGGTFLGLAAAEDGDDEREKGRFSQYMFYRIDLANAANFAAVVRATGTLTMTQVPLPGQTVNIHGEVYTFEAAQISDTERTVAIVPGNLVATRNK
ncbi:MAG TPA: hypothetical protein VLS86_06295, partial [Acidimicrobiia bacterium]|nr:hypothetical protein [Acidimicrobiia bacterium]